MKYKDIKKGEFIDRPNRFVAQVKIENQVHKVHVKNTGRCKELLIPGSEVYLEDFRGRMGTRKLEFSLIGVKKGNLMINMDSQAPNGVVEEGLKSGKIILPGMENLTQIKREKTFGNSRFDFYLEDRSGKKGFMEVKGVTLEESGVAKFPDAPTLRGLKHVEELIIAKDENYMAYVLFVIQMKGVRLFKPNDDTHKDFGDGVRKAQKAGVNILSYDCIVGMDTLEIDSSVAIDLG
ncbi:MAG: DNA/RNA nuclease SfsA [Anaerovoracaceae bacterium]